MCFFLFSNRSSITVTYCSGAEGILFEVVIFILKKNIQCRFTQFLQDIILDKYGKMFSHLV